MAIEHFLEILMDLNMHNTTIAADFELTINSVKKIVNGSALEKVSKN